MSPTTPTLAGSISNDARLTENTRAAYPITHIPNATRDGLGGHPKNIIFLTADAFGVLPPISRLTPEQAMYHFISGYTAKVAGTERGVTEPQPNFSACFGAPFLPLHPFAYAQHAGREELRRHGAQCLAGQHRLVGRALWRGQPHEDPVHARHDHCRAQWQSRRCGDHA